MQNATYTTSQVSSDQLRVGTYDGGTHKARSFLRFSSQELLGRHILSANLVLRNYSSNSCTASAIRAEPISESWAIADVTWTNQPAVDATRYADYSPAKNLESRR